MATYHTNFITGNDTNDGSAGAPFKTINKALSVCVDNDLVKVAGGEIQTITGLGTITTTNRSTTLTTSQNLTGQFAVGDVIFLDTSVDDGFPVAANGLVISAITATTITVNTVSSTHIKSKTYTTFYKLTQYHYIATANNQTFETPGAPIANIVTIEGGWDATFTTQIGWTGVKTPSFTNVSFYSGWNIIKPNIVFNKFLFANITNCFVGSNSSLGINEVAFYACTSNIFGNSNFGVYAPSSIGFTTIYSYGSNITTSWNGSANRPTTLNLKQWQTTTSSATSGIKLGFALSEGNTAGPFIKSLEANWRSLNNSSNAGLWSPFAGSTGDTFIDKLNLFIGGSSIAPLIVTPPTANAWRYVEDINVTIIDGTRSGITPASQTINTSSLGASSDAPLNINRTSGIFEVLPWCSYGTPTASNTVIQAQRSPIFGRDTEGQKVINTDSIPKYADPVEYVTGTNSLRFKIITNSAGTDTYRYFCAILDKPVATTSFTLTVKMKASKTINPGIVTTAVELLYGPAFSKFTSFTLANNITTSWQDFSFTVDPTTLTDWNIGNDGLMQVLISIGSNVLFDTNEVAYLWVDSVSVS